MIKFVINFLQSFLHLNRCSKAMPVYLEQHDFQMIKRNDKFWNFTVFCAFDQFAYRFFHFVLFWYTCVNEMFELSATFGQQIGVDIFRSFALLVCVLRLFFSKILSKATTLCYHSVVQKKIQVSSKYSFVHLTTKSAYVAMTSESRPQNSPDGLRPKKGPQICSIFFDFNDVVHHEFLSTDPMVIDEYYKEVR